MTAPNQQVFEFEDHLGVIRRVTKLHKATEEEKRIAAELGLKLYRQVVAATDGLSIAESTVVFKGVIKGLKGKLAEARTYINNELKG